MKPRRKLTAIVMAAAMMLTMAPAAYAAENDNTSVLTATYNNEAADGSQNDSTTVQAIANVINSDQSAVSANSMEETEFRNAVNNGGTVNMTGDVTLTSPLEITKEVTINGGDNQYSIIYNSANNYVIEIDTTENVTLNNVKITNNAVNGNGIFLPQAGHHFILNNSTVTADTRGVRADNTDSSSVLKIQNSTIQNSRLPEGRSYDNWAAVGDYRGLALGDINNATIDVENSNILGFAYSINITGTQKFTAIGNTTSRLVRDAAESTVNVKNSHIKGWTTFNIWTCRTNFDVENTELLGVNVARGSSNTFSTIKLNNNIYGTTATATAQSDPYANTFSISGGSISNYSSPESLADNNAEMLISIGRGDMTEFSFTRYGRNNVLINDNVGCCTGVFYSQSMTGEQMVLYLDNKVYRAPNAVTLNPDTLFWGSYQESFPDD